MRLKLLFQGNAPCKFFGDDERWTMDDWLMIDDDEYDDKKLKLQ